MPNKIKIGIMEADNCTNLLGIDLDKISCFMYRGSSIEIWMDGAAEPLCIQKSQVTSQAYCQLLDALSDEFSELYGDEFPGEESDEIYDPIPY